MASSIEERRAVRAYVISLFENWRASQDGTLRGDGIAQFARVADVPDMSLRVWLGRAGPKKRELVSVPSAAYLLRLIRAAEGTPVRAGAATGDDELADCLVALADQIHELQRMIEERLPRIVESPQSRQEQSASRGRPGAE